MWENLLILKNKELVMNFEIPPCDRANRGCTGANDLRCWRALKPQISIYIHMSQGGISKFITRSLFFRINKFSHIVISLLPVKFFNNLGTEFNSWPLIKWCVATADFSTCLYLMFLKCSLIRVFKFLLVCPIYILSQPLQSIWWNPALWRLNKEVRDQANRGCKNNISASYRRWQQSRDRVENGRKTFRNMFPLITG